MMKAVAIAGAVLLLLGAGYYILSSGADRVAAFRQAEATIRQAQTTKIGKDRSVVAKLDAYERELRGEMAKGENADVATIQRLDGLMQALMKTLTQTPPTRSGSAIPTPLGPAGVPSTGGAATAGGTAGGSGGAGAASGSCDMDAYQKASLQQYCRALPLPRPDACRCVN